MKTALVTFVTAALLGLASYAGNHSLGVDEVISMLFVTGLVAWTVTMYRHKARPLTVVPPIHLPLKGDVHSFPVRTHRLAA